MLDSVCQILYENAWYLTVSVLGKTLMNYTPQIEVQIKSSNQG